MSPFGEQAEGRRNLEIDDAYGGKSRIKRRKLPTIALKISRIPRTFAQKRGMGVAAKVLER